MLSAILNNAGTGTTGIGVSISGGWIDFGTIELEYLSLSGNVDKYLCVGW